MGSELRELEGPVEGSYLINDDIAPTPLASRTWSMWHIAALWVSFLLFWAVNIYIVWRGPESIKHLEAFSAPVLIAVGLLLIAWVARHGGGLANLLGRSDALLKAQRPSLGPGGYFFLLIKLWRANGRADIIRQ